MGYFTFCLELDLAFHMDNQIAQIKGGQFILEKAHFRQKIVW